MRIVAGTLRGRAIASPSAKTTRPTTDRVRESVFSAVFSRTGTLEGVRVLDAFAGSGALGIEALSRGAESCLFFERDARARKVLEGNLSSLGLARPVARVAGQDVLAAAKRSGALGGPFGLVLLDPPYALDASAVEGLLEALAESGSLDSGAVAVYEHAHENAASVQERFGENASFEVTGAKKYGKIGVLYLEYRGGAK